MVTDEIIENVTNQAYKFGMGLGLSEEDVADLTQEALLAVMEAQEGYDSDLAAFNTFAYQRADFQMKKWASSRQYSVVPVPRALGELLNRARAAETRLQQVLLRQPTNAEIAAEIGLTLEAYEKARVEGEYEQADNSDDQGDPLFDDSVENFEDTVDGSGVIPGPEPLNIVDETAELIERELGRLTEVEAACLVLLYGLRDNHQHTLREAGLALDLSHEMVRRHRDRALAKLRARLPAEVSGEDFTLEGRDNA